MYSHARQGVYEKKLPNNVKRFPEKRRKNDYKKSADRGKAYPRARILYYV